MNTSRDGLMSWRHPMTRLLVSQLLTGTASWSLVIGVFGYATYQLHAQPYQAGLVGVAWGLPPAILAPLVGRLIDARGPKRVAILSGIAAIAVSLGFTIAPGWGLLLTLVLLSGIVRALGQPAVDAMPTWFVPVIDHRTSSVWLGFATNLPVVAGALVSATTISIGGFASVFVLNSAMHLGSLIAVCTIRTRRPVMAESAMLARQRGIRAVLRARRVRTILGLSSIVWISYGCYSVLEILYVRDVLLLPVGVFTLLTALFGVGLLVANLMMTRLANVLTSHRIMLPSVLFIGLSEALYVGTDKLAVAAIGATLWGVGAAIFGPACRANLLSSVKEGSHGSAMAAWRSAQALGNIIPPIGVGVVGQVLGAQQIMIASSAMVVVAAMFAGLRRSASASRHTEAIDPPLPEPGQSASSARVGRARGKVSGIAGDGGRASKVGTR